MGFEPAQPRSNQETVNEFTERMKATLEEAKAALVKAKDDMARYYNQRRTPAPVYKPGDKVFLEADDIQTTRPSRKLAHQRLGPFVIDKQVNPNAYRLRLPRSMSRLHPVFNVVKLTPVPEDPIANRRAKPPPPPVIVDDAEEWEVEEILDSRTHRRRLQYLIKWQGFGREHNSWEAASDVHAPELINEFYRKNPGAPRHIRTLAFSSIPFRNLDVSRRHDLEGGVDVRGTPNNRQLRPFSPPSGPTQLLRATELPKADRRRSDPDTNPDWRSRGTMDYVCNMDNGCWNNGHGLV